MSLKETDYQGAAGETVRAQRVVELPSGKYYLTVLQGHKGAWLFVMHHFCTIFEQSGLSNDEEALDLGEAYAGSYHQDMYEKLRPDLRKTKWWKAGDEKYFNVAYWDEWKEKL